MASSQAIPGSSIEASPVEEEAVHPAVVPCPPTQEPLRLSESEAHLCEAIKAIGSPPPPADACEGLEAASALRHQSGSGLSCLHEEEEGCAAEAAMVSLAPSVSQ